MDDDDVWPVLLAPWPDGPEDTVDCIFIKRALKQLEAHAAGDPENALKLALDGIERNAIAIRYRLWNACENVMGRIAGWRRTREAWATDIAKGYIMTRDTRYWVPVTERRAMPQPHWLFMTRESLNQFLKALPSLSSIVQEHKAIRHVANMLKKDPALSKDKAKAECKQFKISGAGFRYRVWPKAREEARFPARAKPGPKKKNSST